MQIKICLIKYFLDIKFFNRFHSKKKLFNAFGYRKNFAYNIK